MSPEETAELIRLKNLEADERRSPIEKMACEAWDRVRKPADAAFIDLPVDIKYKLINLAEKYAAGNAETEGDYAPVGFAEAVKSLAPAPKPEYSEDTSTHAPNANFDTADANRPPVEHTGEPSDANIPELNSEGSDSAAKKRAMADRAAAAAIDDEPVELKGRLPDDFPSRSVLAAHDINTYHQLRKRLESGEKIPFIGPAAEAKIAERLANPE